MKEANRKEGKMGDEANACVHNDRNDIQIKYSRWFLLSNTPTRCLLRSVPKVGASALNVQRDPRNEINHTHTLIRPAFFEILSSFLSSFLSTNV